MKIQKFFVICSFLLSSLTWANGLDDCRKVETFSSYDYSSFIFRYDTSGPWGGFYRYLLDGSDYQYLNARKTRRTVFKTSVVLTNSSAATVFYTEEEQESIGANSWTTLGTPLERRFDTTWSVVGGQIVVNNLGSGVAMLCDGNPGVYFKISRNLGQFTIAGRSISLHFGGSNRSPL